MTSEGGKQMAIDPVFIGKREVIASRAWPAWAAASSLGLLGDRFGAKPVLIAGLLVQAVAIGTPSSSVRPTAA
jgi:hypothetical protein